MGARGMYRLGSKPAGGRGGTGTSGPAVGSECARDGSKTGWLSGRNVMANARNDSMTAVYTGSPDDVAGWELEETGWWT